MSFHKRQELLKKYNFSNKAHPFHLVEPSFLPFLTSLSVGVTLFGAVSWFHKLGFDSLFTFGTVSTLFCIFFWIRSIFAEADAGFHTNAVRAGLKFGFILFIVSEIMFFFSFFWALFHSSLSPSIFIGGVWPPLGIKCFSPWSIPLLNTLVLLTSGLTVTRTHILLMLGNYRLTNCLLDTTIILGIGFLFLQYFEYKNAPFSISDSVYGSVFFLLTGFHGFHVFLGLCYLCITKYRLVSGALHIDDHQSFEFASWYWHFVDVVWIFVYFTLYIWSNRFV